MEPADEELLARYGHHPAPPAEGEAAVPEGREPASVVGEPSDEDVLRVAAHALDYVIGPPWNFEAVPMSADDVLTIARAVLARYGHQPAPPVESEVAELVEWLRDDLELHPAEKRRAADLLSQRHPTPVPAAERLPEPADCDDEGTCWAWNRTAYTWGLFRLDLTAHSHWLPATALPLPAGEVE